MAAAVMAIRQKRKDERKRENGSLIPIKVVKIFRKYDVDDGGTIDFEEFQMAVKDMKIGLPESKEIVYKIYETYGGDEDGMELRQFDILISAMAKFRTVDEPFVKDSIFGKGKPLPRQREVRAFYLRPTIVWTVAFVICANFAVNIIEKEIDADLAAPRYTQLWENLDLIFNCIFLLELMLNMYGYGGPVRAFWAVGWNVFDFIIVVLAFVTNIPGLPDGLSRLKLLRAFRVFRLFKRVKSLNKIIMSLLAAIPGTTNAFVVLFIFFCIYAILAVELFRTFGLEGTYDGGGPFGDNGTVTSETPRGYANGDEYYGTYTRAMYTLFQVFTGDSWSESVARPLLFGMYADSMIVGMFYVSFVILTQLVLMNVVMAVLLDKFVSDDKQEDDGTMTEEQAKKFLEFSGIDTSALKQLGMPAPPPSSGGSRLSNRGPPDGGGVSDNRKSQRRGSCFALPHSLASVAGGAPMASAQEVKEIKTSLVQVNSRVEGVELTMQEMSDAVNAINMKLDALTAFLNVPVPESATLNGQPRGGASSASAAEEPPLETKKDRRKESVQFHPDLVADVPGAGDSPRLDAGPDIPGRTLNA